MKKKQVPVLNVEIAAAGWKKQRGLKALFEKAFAATREEMPARLRKLAEKSEITVLLTTNAAVHKLNREWRGKDKPTNILSFPQHETRDFGVLARSELPIYMGDMALAYQYVVAEAKKEHKILKNHLSHLIIHGILHIFGYDHLTDRDARQMETMEKKIMARLGLPDPYKIYAPAQVRLRTSNAKRVRAIKGSRA